MASEAVGVRLSAVGGFTHNALAESRKLSADSHAEFGGNATEFQD
jgi:hypothetical protein